MVNQRLNKVAALKYTTRNFIKKTELMLDLSVEALKMLMYLQEDLLKKVSNSKFLMLTRLRSKAFSIHIQVRQTSSCQVLT